MNFSELIFSIKKFSLSYELIKVRENINIEQKNILKNQNRSEEHSPELQSH